MQSDRRIAWAGAKLNGVILEITVEEAALLPDGEKGGDPASIYATHDGVITRITVLDGQALCHVGDAVRKGEVLISGVINNPGYAVMRARGEIIATVLYRFGGEAGPQLHKPVRTGNASEFMRIRLFGFAIDSNRVSYGAEEIAPISFQRMENCFLPIVVESLKSYELKNSMVNASTRELEAEAERRAQQSMLSGLPKDMKILSKETEIIILENGTVRAVITLTVEESIGETRGIDG